MWINRTVAAGLIWIIATTLSRKLCGPVTTEEAMFPLPAFLLE